MDGPGNLTAAPERQQSSEGVINRNARSTAQQSVQISNRCTTANLQRRMLGMKTHKVATHTSCYTVRWKVTYLQGRQKRSYAIRDMGTALSALSLWWL